MSLSQLLTQAKSKTLEIVKATVPVLEEHGTAITTVFYKNMFNEHPELLDIFNETNQKLGQSWDGGKCRPN